MLHLVRSNQTFYACCAIIFKQALQSAADKVNQKVTIRTQVLVLLRLMEEQQLICAFAQEGYDHSYYFIASFLEDHIDFHAQRLLK